MRVATKIQKWGNSLALRIPKAIAESANLKEGSDVEVKFDDQVIQIIP